MDKRNKKSVLKKALEIFGFTKMSEYESAFHADANVKSSIYMSGIIIALEIWMLVRYVYKYVFVTKECTTLSYFYTGTKSYWILLSTGLVMLVYSILYTSRKIKKNRLVSNILTILFTGICMYFGWIVSASDYKKGRMIICFMTMVLYVACLLIWRPYISLVMLSAIAISYVYYLDSIDTVLSDLMSPEQIEKISNANKINYATYFISLITIVISIYNQRHSEAKKSHKLMLSSVTDDLTGIANVRGFAEAAEKKIAEKGRDSFVYLFFNIENFKLYNNHMGYVKGNELLVRIAEIISGIFNRDIVARQADDHFIVLTESKDYMEKIDKVREAVKSDVQGETYLDIKAGGYHPKGDLSDPRLEMDRARYAANTISGKADKSYAEYDEKMDEGFRLRNHIINNVDKAVKEGYIQVYYQPVVWSDDKKLCGCEALARWIDPDFGFLSPGAFIPVLEEARQINKLDLCVYETVCRDLRSKIDEGKKVFPVSLNFSRLDFELMDAVDELEKLVNKYSIPKELIHVEITESALTNDSYGLKQSMDRLHELGYSIWLDDFGSGYSSLNVLKDFNFDLLKIDMVFLRNFAEAGFEENTKNTKNIIISILNLAEQLGMKTLTEGVENEDAADFLARSGCGRLQGYYYSKPVPIADIYKMIDEGKLSVSDRILK